LFDYGVPAGGALGKPNHVRGLCVGVAWGLGDFGAHAPVTRDALIPLRSFRRARQLMRIRRIAGSLRWPLSSGAPGAPQKKPVAEHTL